MAEKAQPEPDEALPEPKPGSSEPGWLRELARMPECAPESLPPASFAPGEHVGRFELLRELGRGGFGIVFEARDLQLHRLVAIKSMRARHPDGPEAEWAARFEREAQAVARLNHPNIVTLYDHGVHRTVPFLVLELLSGETLQETLSRGPLPASAALDVVVQVLRALVHAHHLGIIHRDLKPSNVFLGSDGVVSVLDFGLAQVRDALEAPPSKLDAALFHSLPGSGTVSFMSPEQARGEPEDGRSDIFAVGALLRVTLGDQQIPQPLAVIVERAAAIAPQDRFGTSKELLDALVAARHDLANDKRRETRPRRLLYLLGAVAALGAVVAVTSRGQVRVAPRPSTTVGSSSLAPAAPSQPRRAVAILGFKNLAARPEAAWLSAALGEMLNSELAAGEQLRTIEAANIAGARTGLQLDLDQIPGTEALVRLGSRLSADYFVLGSYVLVAGGEKPARIRIDLRLQDARTGGTLAAIGDDAIESELIGLVARLGASLRGRLEVAALTSAQDKQVRASLPSHPAAARLYAEGLGKLRSFDYSAAREQLGQAVALEPGFPMAHVALAEVLWTIGDETAARVEAKRALDLSEELWPVDRLLVEGRYWETAGEADKAVEVYARLFQDYPDDPDHGFRLLRAQWRAGNVGAMAMTLGRLRRLPPGVNEDPRIYQGEARLAVAQGDGRRAVAATQALIAKGTAEGARALVYEGRMFEGAEHWKQGAHELALRSYREALVIARAIGDRNAAAGALWTIGMVLVDQGRLAEANKSFAALDVSGGEVRGALAGKLLGLGLVALRQGNLAESRSRSAAALEAAGKSEGHKYMIALTTLRLATDAHAAGGLQLANELAESALQAFRGLDWPGDIAHALSSQGATLAMQGDLAGARARVEEALAIWQRRDSPVEVARCRAALAAVALDDGRAADAGDLAGQALEMFKRAPALADERALARAVLGESLWVQGKRAAAKEVVAQLSASEGATSARSERLEVRLRVALARALVEGDAPAVQAALTEASRAGLAEPSLRARLLSASLETKARRRQKLKLVADDAAARGFVTIARKARAVLSPPAGDAP